MGTPSDGKIFPPDELCEQCGCILIGAYEKSKGICEECQDRTKDEKE